MSFIGKESRIERFGEISEVIPLPNLTEIQVNSFRAFLQADRAPDKRDNVGLQSAFKEVFPIDETEKGRSTGLVLDYLEYRLGDPPYTPEECREKDLTYQAPMYAKLQLIHKDSGLIKEDQVFLGDLPLMTEDGSFVINGADRVVISQIHRSPGVYFTSSYKGIKKLYTGAIIPMPKRGPWIELEFAGGILEMKVNKRKFPVAMLLRVLGYDDSSLKTLFSEFDPGTELPEDKSAGMGADEALLRLFTVLRPGDPPKRDKATQYLYGLLADPRRYDLGKPGRFKMNRKLGLDREEYTLLDLRRRQVQRRGAGGHHPLPDGAAPRPRNRVHDGTRRQDARRAGGRGRHRPPRQPPHPDGGRTAGRSDPRGSGPHGAWRTRAHAARQPRRRHAAQSSSTTAPSWRRCASSLGAAS